VKPLRTHYHPLRAGFFEGVQRETHHRSRTIIERQQRLRKWFTDGGDPVQQAVDALDIGWGGVQLWATGRMPPVEGWHLDVGCGYATFLAQLGWRFRAARLVGLNIDFEGPHALARPLLDEAGVAAVLVQADARCLPFASGSLDSGSCFLGLQDVEIGFGQEGVQQVVAETARVLRAGGNLVLLDEFPFGRFDLLLHGLPLAVIDRAERALDVCWSREVAERAIALYAEGWAAQARLKDESARELARRDAYRRMAADMEHQLAEQGYYVPFGPVRMVVARKESDACGGGHPARGG
jgi:SAM-dependent methyltransferase